MVIDEKTGEDAFYDLLTSNLDANRGLVVLKRAECPSIPIEQTLYFLWVLGFKLRVVQNPEEYNEQWEGVIRWHRPFILRTENENLRRAAEKLGTFAPQYEQLPCSAYDVRRAIIDCNLWETTDYMLPHFVTTVAVGFGYETPPLPKADVYFLFSQLLFHYIPDEHTPQDVIINEVKPIFIEDVKSSHKWSARQPVACVIDPRCLTTTEIEHTIKECEKMRIPTITPNPDTAEQFKIVLYPVSERMMHYSLPREFTKILGRFTFIITTTKGALNYPMVYRDVAYAHDGTLLLHCLLCYSTYKDILNSDATFRITEFVEFLKTCTWEGILFRMLGSEHYNLFYREGEV